MSRITAIASLLLAACGSVDTSQWECVDAAALTEGHPCRNPLPVTVAPDVDVELVVQAVVQWNDLAQRLIGHDALRWEVTSTEPIVQKAAMESLQSADHDPSLGDVGGYHDHGRVYCGIPIPSVVTHELGHYLGNHDQVLVAKEAR